MGCGEYACSNTDMACELFTAWSHNLYVLQNRPVTESRLPNDNRCLSHLFSGRKGGNSVHVGNAHQSPSLTVAICMIMFSDFSHRLTMSTFRAEYMNFTWVVEKNPLSTENKHPICTCNDKVSKWGGSEEQVFFLYEWTITPRRDDISLLWRFFQYSR